VWQKANEDMSDFVQTAPTDLRLLAALGDETDPALVQVLDRARRGDGLLPTRSALEHGPLSEPGDAMELFCMFNCVNGTNCKMSDWYIDTMTWVQQN